MTAPIMALRPAVRADAPALALLHASCFADAWSMPAMLDVLDLAGAFGSVVACAGLPLAGLALARVAADEAELLTLAVGAVWRRQGIARALIDATVAEAGQRGARHLFLEVAEDNDAARRLYTAEGFTPIGRRRGYYTRPGAPAVDALTLRRILAPGA
jgi:ribosomal-protein-alanine N-acetyltransferase